MRDLTTDERAHLGRLEDDFIGVGYFVVTGTMLTKNNTDANSTIRQAARDAGVLDYDELDPGESGPTIANVAYVGRDDRAVGELRHYRTNRGDRRFSFYSTAFSRVADVDDVWAVCYGGDETAALVLLGSETDGFELAAAADGDIAKAPLRTIKPRAGGRRRAGLRDAADITRREDELLIELVDALDAAGHQAWRRTYMTDDGSLIESDLVVADLDLLGEVKGEVTRENVRMAIGQLADYERFEHYSGTTAVVLPERPSSDLISLITSQGHVVIHKRDGRWWMNAGPADGGSRPFPP